MIKLSILTPRCVCLSAKVESVRIPSSDRACRILQRHCPIITSFEERTLSYRIDRTSQNVSLKKGLIKVQNDIVTVLCSAAT